MTDEPDFYEVLEIAHDADADAVRAAVRAQRRKWRQRSNSPELKRRLEAETRIEQIAEAERTLLDPADRASYDDELTRLAGLAAAPAPTDAEAAGGATAGGGATRHDEVEPTHGTAGRAPSQPDHVEHWLQTSAEYARAGQLENASRAAQEATRLDPQRPEPWLARGGLSLRLDRPQDAEFELSEARRHGGVTPPFLKLFAETMRRQGRSTEAEQAYRELVQLDAGNDRPVLQLVREVAEQGRLSDALEISRQYRTPHPGSTILENQYVQISLRQFFRDVLSRDQQGNSFFTTAAQVQAGRDRLAELAELRLDDATRLEVDRLKNDLAVATARKFTPSCAAVLGVILGVGMVLGGFAQLSNDGGALALLIVAIGAVVAGLLVRGMIRPQWQLNKRFVVPGTGLRD